MTLGDVMYLFIKRTRNVPSFLYPIDMYGIVQELHVNREKKTSWLISPHLRMCLENS